MSTIARIGFDGRTLASPAAGVRRYARELFGALAGIDRTLRIVAVGAPAEVGLPAEVERVDASTTLPSNLGWMLRGLPQAARRAELDLFHAPSYTAPFRGPRPMVLTIHDVSYARHPEWYPYKRDVLRRAFYRRSARTADRIITDSAFSKSEIVDVYRVRPSLIDVVPLAASAAFTPGPAGPLPAEWPTQFVLHVGDLHERRNLAMVARAVVALRRREKSLSRLSLVLAGVDRGSAPQLAQISAAAGGAVPLVVFAGQTTDTMLLTLYRSAAAFVYPSRYEGFGLPLLEAMSCGTPVIGARAASIPEVIGDAGVLLDPNDEAAWSETIERVLEDRVYSALLRGAGLERAARFSWFRTATETAAVYRRVLHGRKR